MPELLSVKVIPTEQCLLILTEQYTHTYIGEGNARAALCQGQQPPSDCSARTAPGISYASYLPIYQDMDIDMSMAPAAPPGKPRCLVSEGVWCLKVYDIISGPDRWQGSGVSPAAGGENALYAWRTCRLDALYVTPYMSHPPVASRRRCCAQYCSAKSPSS